MQMASVVGCLLETPSQHSHSMYKTFQFSLPRLPTGALIISMQSLSGENIRERKRKERLELHELRLAEW